MERKTNIGRREFLRKLGRVTAAVAATTAVGCVGGGKKSEEESSLYDVEREVPTDRMTLRVNPRNGDKVSILGYGCMRLPRIDGSTSKDVEIDQEQVNRLTMYAFEHGVNYYDTSPRYCQGKSEHAMGIALKQLPRDRYFLATKLSNFAPETHSWQASYEMYRNSFRELQVDYLDYYLLHSLSSRENYEKRYVNNGILPFLMDERRKGRIRNLGFSFHGDRELFDFLMQEHEKYHWDFVQIQMNYMDWTHAASSENTNADYLYAELEKRGIPVVVMEPLLGGSLADVHQYLVPEFLRREPGMTVASWAFRFAGSFPGVLTVLSGMTYIEHLKDNIITYSPLKPLSEEEKGFLEEIAGKLAKFDTIPCTDCKYCMPCPYGLDIPAIFHHYNKCINENTMPLSTEESTYDVNRRAFLVGYDRSVPKLRQADHCIGCHKCVPKCPQHIKINREMGKINRYVESLKQRKEIEK